MAALTGDVRQPGVTGDVLGELYVLGTGELVRRREYHAGVALLVVRAESRLGEVAGRDGVRALVEAVHGGGKQDR